MPSSPTLGPALLCVLLAFAGGVAAQSVGNTTGNSTNGTDVVVPVDPAGPVAPVCMQDLFLEVANYQLDVFNAQRRQCEANIRRLMQQQFGPPSAYEVFLAACKGACRQYMARWQRLAEAAAGTHCNCAEVFGDPFFCAPSPAELVCRTTGFCVNASFYEASTCGATACGRWASNEADYRRARPDCGVSFDSGAPVQSSLAVGVALLAAAAAARAAAG